MDEIETSRRGLFGAAAVGVAGVAMAGPALAQGARATFTAKEAEAAVKAAHAKYRTLNDGANADYIPALAQVNPDYFGIALVTADGRVFEAGDVTPEFSIQSISKAGCSTRSMRSSSTRARR